MLLNVPAYDFNWQHGYELRQPIDLPADFAIVCDAAFDNSDGNPANPDPTATVHWGDQSFEEMMIGFLEVAVPRQPPADAAPSREPTRDEQRDAAEYVDRLFDRFDRNDDGRLARRELPEVFGMFVLRRYDLTDDGVVTRDEAERAVVREDLLR